MPVTPLAVNRAGTATDPAKPRENVGLV